MIAYASHSTGTAGLILAFVMLFLIFAVAWCIKTDKHDGQIDGDDGPIEPLPNEMRP